MAGRWRFVFVSKASMNNTWLILIDIWSLGCLSHWNYRPKKAVTRSWNLVIIWAQKNDWMLFWLVESCWNKERHQHTSLHKLEGGIGYGVYSRCIRNFWVFLVITILVPQLTHYTSVMVIVLVCRVSGWVKGRCLILRSDIQPEDKQCIVCWWGAWIEQMLERRHPVLV